MPMPRSWVPSRVGVAQFCRQRPGVRREIAEILSAMRAEVEGPWRRLDKAGKATTETVVTQ